MQGLERAQARAGFLQPLLQIRHLSFLLLFGPGPLLHSVNGLAGFLLYLSRPFQGAVQSRSLFPPFLPAGIQRADNFRFLFSVSNGFSIEFFAPFLFCQRIVLQVRRLVRQVDETFLFSLHCRLEIPHLKLDLFQIRFLVSKIGLFEQGELDEFLLSLLQLRYFESQIAAFFSQMEQVGLGLLLGVAESGEVLFVEIEALFFALNLDLTLVDGLLLLANLSFGF